MFNRGLGQIPVVMLFVVFSLTGCGALQGNLKYDPPTGKAAINSKDVDRPREQVWAATVPKLGKQFFVINNIDKASGLINVSYSGNPGSYVDCGIFSSYVKNLAGERNYSFQAASPREVYEVINNAGLWRVDRTMSLEGRVNMVFEEVSPQKTRVTANTRYVLTRTAKFFNPLGAPGHVEGPASMTFTSAGPSTGGLPTAHTSMTCMGTGRLEQELLNLVE